ncbi:MAG: hypothetical protein U0R19_26925 [Bryobacteraceae bacterium]
MSTVITGDSRLRGSDLDHRIHDVAWGLLLALTGVIWMIPAGKVPEGAWLVGVAAILLGANAVRRVVHVPVSWFSLALGCMALLAAMSQWWGIELPLLPTCLIVIGVSLVVKPLFAARS